MRRELFLLFVEARREKVRKKLDEEVERITGKDCDEAARTLSRSEFRRVAEEAMRNVLGGRKKKRSKEAVEVAAYA